MISTLIFFYVIFLKKFKEKLVTKVKKNKNEKNNPVPSKNLIFFFIMRIFLEKKIWGGGISPLIHKKFTVLGIY